MTKNEVSKRTILFATAATLAFAFATPAAAQVQEQVPAPQEDQSATDVDEGEIVITAQKREQKILDIPQSVTVVSGDTLERQHATTFQDYLSQVPGLSLEQSEPGVGRLVLRGVNTGGVASTIAVYIDETPFGSSSGLVNGAELAGDFDTFDIARIEVLRGPQGTLYGASSLGGVLKFVTNTPKLGDFSARARAGVEFVDDGGTGYSANGVVNVPLGETAAVRATGFYRKRAGWVDTTGEPITMFGLLPGQTVEAPSLIGDDNINENDVWGGRVSALIQPIEPLTVRLTAIAQNIKSDGSSDVEVDPTDYDPIDGDLQRTVFINEPNKLKYRLYNGVIQYDLGFGSLLSSTSFGKQNQSFRDDYTAPFGGAINVFYAALHPGLPPELFPFPQVTEDVVGLYNDQTTNLKKFTQEVRLASPSNDRFEWMVGAYYTRERGSILQHFAATSLVTGEDFSDPILGNQANLLLESRYSEIAGFANVTWHATDRFDITAGGRLSQNDQSASQVSQGIAPILPSGGETLPTIDSKEDVFTYSLSPRFELNDTTAVYARVAKGYRPGGPNVLSPGAPDEFRTYQADTITSYEVGLKTDFARRMSFDLSLYHLKWKDIQLLTSVDNFNFNTNGGKAESTGLEATLNVRPIRGMNVNFNVALIDAELTSDTPEVVGGFKGDTLPYVPKAMFSINGDYEWNLTQNTTAFVGGTISFRGEQKDNFVLFGAPQREIPNYTTLDLRAGAQFDRFTVDAFVRNVTNTRGITSLGDITDALTGQNPLPGGAIRASFIQPRTIGFTLGAEF